MQKPKELHKIFWRDHASNAKWLDKDELQAWIKEQKEDVCESIGKVVYEDRDVVVIAADKNANEVGSCSLIYKKLVVKREKL